MARTSSHYGEVVQAEEALREAQRLRCADLAEPLAPFDPTSPARLNVSRLNPPVALGDAEIDHVCRLFGHGLLRPWCGPKSPQAGAQDGAQRNQLLVYEFN